MNNQSTVPADGGLMSDALKSRLIAGVAIFLGLVAFNYMVVPDTWVEDYVEKCSLLISSILNSHFGEQTRVLWENTLGLRVALKEGVGRETEVVYGTDYLNYPVLFMFIAVVAVWTASVTRKLLAIIFAIPIFFGIEFALMICAYFVEVYAPLSFNIYRVWIYPIVPVLFCVLIFLIFTRGSGRADS